MKSALLILSFAVFASAYADGFEGSFQGQAEVLYEGKSTPCELQLSIGHPAPGFLRVAWFTNCLSENGEVYWFQQRDSLLIKDGAAIGAITDDRIQFTLQDLSSSRDYMTAEIVKDADGVSFKKESFGFVNLMITGKLKP